MEVSLGSQKFPFSHTCVVLIPLDLNQDAVTGMAYFLKTENACFYFINQHNLIPTAFALQQMAVVGLD